VAIAANLLTVLPPPQPTSRIVWWFGIEMCSKPQSVSLEWLEFIRHKVNRPSHPVGLLH